MSGERQKIRAAMKAVVEKIYAGKVFDSRVFEARGVPEFVSIYLESGEVVWDGLKATTTAELVISYQVEEFTDDAALDEVADRINDALATERILPDLIQGLMPAGFEYLPEKESAFSGIAQRYTIIY